MYKTTKQFRRCFIQELRQQEAIDDNLRNYIKRIQQQKEWTLYSWVENEKDDYFGAAFWNSRYNQLVISHRGTVPKIKKSVLTDIEGVVKKKYTSQVNSACTFSAFILKDLDQSKIHISITGHSLDAWLGQVSTFVMEYLMLKDNVFTSRKCRNPIGVIHCVVLDSPACYEMLCQISGHYYHKYDKEAFLLISALDIPTE